MKGENKGEIIKKIKHSDVLYNKELNIDVLC